MRAPPLLTEVLHVPAWWQDGTLSLVGAMSLECLESARELGVRTLYMSPADFTKLVERAPQVGHAGRLARTHGEDDRWMMRRR